MVSNHFAFLLLLRTTLLLAMLIGLSIALTTAGYYGTTTLLALATIIIISELYHYVSSTNAELIRFLGATRYEDFSQRFQASKSGARFEQLSAAFNETMQRFNTSRQQQEQSLRHLKSLMEHSPVPLLSLYPNSEIKIHNNAARHLFASVKVNSLEDLRGFGVNFFEAIKSIKTGNRKLATLSFDGMERQFMLVATKIITGNNREILISMQDIQHELDSAQLQAWKDLVRVLTHEIMNSITPVSSLAKSASELMGDLRAKIPPAETDNNDHIVITSKDLEQVHLAIDTVARRSDGLMSFVQNYRNLTQLPAPEKQSLSLLSLLNRIRDLLSSQWNDKNITLTLQVSPENLRIDADPNQLEQLLINIMHNAEQALLSTDTPHVSIIARQNQRGYVLIEISDNGAGIPTDIIEEIFLPFFTTKKSGSGVGLSLARQIMTAHGGSVTAGTSLNGGAKFSLIF